MESSTDVLGLEKEAYLALARLGQNGSGRRNGNGAKRLASPLYIGDVPSIDAHFDNVDVPEELLEIIPELSRALEGRVYSYLRATALEAKDTLNYLGKIPMEFRPRYGIMFPGHLVVINFEPENPSHYSHIESLNGNHPIVGKSVYSVPVAEFADLGMQNGATLIDRTGKIVGVKQRLVNLEKPYDSIPPDRTASRVRGFAQEGVIGTRGFSAMDASYVMPSTVVYVTSKERPGELRRMVAGKITYSTVKGEVARSETATR
ncbi:MAG: hypothetical protein V1740_03930 [Candidatus Woesearchaeota archaeon]